MEDRLLADLAQARLIKLDQLDWEDYCSTQREAYAELLASQGSNNAHMVPAFFEWKYRPPGCEGRIAIVTEGEKIIASNAMFPMRLHTPRGNCRAWQSCDTATLPQARGKGCFAQCIHTLSQSLPEGDWFLGFPNANSRRGFEKLGWQLLRPVDTWVRPYIGPIWAGEFHHQVLEVGRFGPEQERLNACFKNSGATFFYRSPDYLNWRYCQHPLYRYKLLAFVAGTDWLGFAVVRPGRVLRKNFLLILDLWALNAKVESALLGHAAAVAKVQGLTHAVLFDTGGRRLPKWRRGFCKVPPRFLSKRQLLMGQIKGAATDYLDWRVQLGDWDVF